MESSTSAINVQVDTNDKIQATKILKDLGLNMSTLINMTLKQVIRVGGIPFDVRSPKPSKELLEALKESEDIINGKIKSKGYTNIDELFKDLDSDDWIRN